MFAGSIFEKLFTHDKTSTTSRIIDLEEAIYILGIGINTDTKHVYRDIPTLGKRFQKYKQRHEIPNKRSPWGFAAVSSGFHEESGTFTYFIGDRVTSIEQVPDGLTAFEIPARKYVVFPVRPKNRFGWAIAIPSAKRYIYYIWLPNSPYETAWGSVDDFEYHDERSTRKKNPEIDLYVAIKEKHP